MSAPDVAVIIRAFNEERHLGALLDALQTQRGRSFETVVVDSGSTDLTVQIAARRADHLVRIDSRDFTFGFSLNVGIRSTSAPLVAIISAHALPAGEDWLDRLTAPLRGERVAMVYGAQRGVARSNYAERRDFERTFGPHAQRLTPPRFFANNANAATRRDLWATHPFDERLPGLEDIEFAKYWMERGYDVLYEPAATIAHIHEETWRQVRRRYHREAVAACRIGLKDARAILPESLVEAARAVSDLRHAGKDGALWRRAGEIVRFRFEKVVGNARGLLDGARWADRASHAEELFDRYHQAVVVHRAHHVRVEEVALPEVKPADVLVKVAYAGICGTDVEIIDGSLGYYATGMARYPITPGHEFAGRIAMVGANAGAWAVGDPVVVECIQSCGRCAACRRGNPIGCPERTEVGVIGRNGGFADYMVTPARFVHRLPPRTDLRVGALCEPVAVVLKGLRRLERHWGAGDTKRCAVVGVGPIGYLSAIILARRGHDVTVFDREPERRALFPKREVDLSRLSDADAIVEATGDPAALDALLRHSGAGAAILLLGLPYARREFDFESIVAFDKVLIGSVGSGREDFAEAVSLVGALDTAPLLQASVPFRQFPDALALVRKRRYPKVLLEIDPLLNTAQADPLSAPRPSSSPD